MKRLKMLWRLMTTPNLVCLGEKDLAYLVEDLVTTKGVEARR